MLSKIYSVAIVGLEAIPVTIEIDTASQGLPHFIIVGLPNKSVDEAKERVKSAIRNTGFEFPNKKITVNMAPADVPKEGSLYDLPIALGILIASEQIPPPIKNFLIFGELSLDGYLRSSRGAILYAILAKEKSFDGLIVPAVNAGEAGLIAGVEALSCTSLVDAVKKIKNEDEDVDQKSEESVFYPSLLHNNNDMTDIIGQHKIKRAMEIAAAGSHNMVMIGSPGSGKTLLARTFSTILPDLTHEEAIELTKLYSIAGLLSGENHIINFRPFRSPHHSSSVPSIVGGGSYPRPGEISLAHRGVLFLDELLEFPKTVLEALRQPLEDGKISVSRTALSVTYPAKFIMLAAANPCPCGYAGTDENQRQCTCTPMSVERYKKKLSGPILDRIDLQVRVHAIPIHELTDASPSEPSSTIRERVQRARNRQAGRFTMSDTRNNGEMGAKQVKQFCKINEETRLLLHEATKKFNLSARSFHRILKVSRTIADLSDHDAIKYEHVAEALQYRFVGEV